mgnify:CR=1 FL=1
MHCVTAMARLSLLAGNIIKKADGGKTGNFHLFRHTTATVMLENGADIRYIQEMLDHARVGITQIYTQASIRGLKEIRTAPHAARSPERD